MKNHHDEVMQMHGTKSRWLIVAAASLVVIAGDARAQTPSRDGSSRDTAKAATQQSSTAKAAPEDATRLTIYGFAMADFIYDFKRNNPQWFDVNRPSRLPSFAGEFGDDKRMQVSARQSKIGAKASIPTGEGRPDIKTVWEFDLFGVGVDAGQTTIRPRHMYGEWGHFGAGQTNSAFMDGDVFPNVIEYWGPNGMLFFRNVMVWWHPVNKANGTQATIALERPGASGDLGVASDRVEINNVTPRFPAPDITANYRWGGSFGYIRLSGIVRWMSWDDNLPDTLDFSGSTSGWGVALSSNWKWGANTTFRGIGVYGAGVENYFNDAPIDVGAKANPGHRFTPVTGEALPDFGMSTYVDHNWNSHFSSTIGYSRVDIDNSDLQASNAFRVGQYASTNLLWTPVPNVMMGGEFQWAQRRNKSNGFTFDDYRLQFSFKYSFSQSFGGSSR